MMQTIEARESEARRYKLLTEFTRDIILFIRRNDFRIIDANASAVEAYGYAQDELRGLHLRNLRAETALPRRMEDRFAEIDRSAVVYETVHRRKDGTEFPVEVSAAKTELDGETVVMLIIRDISGRKMTEAATIRAQVSESARIALELEVTERKEVERRLAFAAFTTISRSCQIALFMDRLQQTLARQQRYPDATAAILFLDIDRFKVINDSPGTPQGTRCSSNSRDASKHVFARAIPSRVSAVMSSRFAGTCRRRAFRNDSRRTDT
jgi:PAS domain S-box-containing protein